MLLGRNNFGANLVSYQPPCLKSERQVVKMLKKACGRKYPVSVKTLIKKIKREGECLLMVNDKGLNTLEGFSQTHIHSSNVERHSHYEWVRDNESMSLKRQCFGFMKNAYRDDLKMKEPK